MRILPITIALTAIAVAGGALARNQIDPDSMPKLRAGYWETTSTTQKTNGKETMTSFLCIDDAVQQKMSVFAQGGMGGMCSEVSMTPQGANRWAYRSVCNPGNMGRVVSEGTISGDMRTRYRSEAVTTGSVLGQSVNDTTVQEARHLGACPKGIVPGDIVTSEGKINMIEMSAIAQETGGLADVLGGILGSAAQGESAGQSRNGQADASAGGLPQEASEALRNLGGALNRMLGR